MDEHALNMEQAEARAGHVAYLRSLTPEERHKILLQVISDCCVLKHDGTTFARRLSRAVDSRPTRPEKW
jgi:hypothetical protein